MSAGRRVHGAALLSTLVRQIKSEWLDGYGIPWDEYLPATIQFDEYGIVCSVAFEHRVSGRVLRVSEIWLGDRGEINQAGSNFGDLTL